MFDSRSRLLAVPSVCRADQWSVLERELEGAWLEFLADHEVTPVLSPDLLALIVSVDPARLSVSGRLAMVRLSERALGMLAAAQVRLIAAISAEAQAAGLGSGDQQWAEVAGVPVDQPERELIAVALRLAPRTASERVEVATDLVARLPGLVDELAAGRIGYQHARVIAEETANLDPDLAREVAWEVIPLARRAAVGRVRRRTSILTARHDLNLAKRHLRARECRRVFVHPEPDGMALFGLVTDQITARRLFDTIDDRAHQHQCPGELIDQVRADTLTHLILNNPNAAATADAATNAGASAATAAATDGIAHAANGDSRAGGNSDGSGHRCVARIAVHTDLPTLLGFADNPGIVPGLGAVPAELVRLIASDGKWIRFLHDHTGTLTEISPYTYRPSAALAAYIRARDQHCQFPHCTQPASRCDLDHIQPFNHTNPETGGTTTSDNLHALCRRHHRLKTLGTWQVTRQPNGTSRWTGPTGQTHTDHPPEPPPPF